MLPYQPKETLNRKIIFIEMKAREEGFRMNPGITYSPVLVVKIFKVEIAEIVTKNFEKRSRGLSQRAKKGMDRLASSKISFSLGCL